jgi:hypothetical protein
MGFIILVIFSGLLAVPISLFYRQKPEVIASELAKGPTLVNRFLIIFLLLSIGLSFLATLFGAREACASMRLLADLAGFVFFLSAVIVLSRKISSRGNKFVLSLTILVTADLVLRLTAYEGLRRCLLL